MGILKSKLQNNVSTSKGKKGGKNKTNVALLNIKNSLFFLGIKCIRLLNLKYCRNVLALIQKKILVYSLDHFSAVSTYHPVVSSCVFNLSSEYLKLIYITSFAR